MKQQPSANMYQPYVYYPQAGQQSLGTTGQSLPYYGAQPTFPQTVGAGMPHIPFPKSAPTTAAKVPGMLPIEESYIENILRLNKGKLVTVYTTFENNREWNAKIFKGVIEAAGRDHLILSNPQTGERDLIPMVYVDYITFQEEIEYEPHFGGGFTQPLSSYPPR